MAAVDSLRSAERAFLEWGDECHLDRAVDLVQGPLREAPFAPATLLWLSLLRYDRNGDDRHLDTVVGACRADNWQNPVLADVYPAVLLRRWARNGEAGDLDHAIRLARATRAGEPSSIRDVPLWLTPAWRAIDLAHVYLERSRLHTTSDDLLAARGILRAAVRDARQPAIEALGLRHLAGCEQELYLRHGTRHLLDHAIRRLQHALAMIGKHSVLRPMLLTELGTALQDRFAADGHPGDIDDAVSLAEEALVAATSGASRPDLACHLVNLGTALSTRYELTGDPRDLNAAVRRYTAALDVLPPTSAYRAAFLERLALGLLMRWEHESGDAEDLDAAIGYCRVAVRDGAASPDVAVYACHMADALEHRWELHRDPADLHEAVRVFATVMSRQSGDGARGADLACNFAHTLLARYQAMGDPDDLNAAMATLSRLPARRFARCQRATVAALAARALSMRYQANGDPDDLATAITAARRGLAGVDVMSMTYNSRTARLAHLLYLRYARKGRGRDLAEAIRLLHDKTTDVARRDLTADQLSQLSGYLAERYVRDGNPADRDEAILLSRRARASDRRDEEPSLDSTLAVVLHERFNTEGWLDDLDEAIVRHRRALARQVPTSIVYPVILNNLGIALQDCYLYLRDHSLLDEAIELHERAVTLCAPGSPDHAGYLGTLAAAVQLRYERDHRTADLDRVISLGEQALADLEPGAPERATLLSSLAAARHLRARDTSESVDFDSAISTYQAALRKTRNKSPMRPSILASYARVLGDHPSGHHPKVLHAFRQALAASARVPAVRLNVASLMGEWALHSGRWPEAAEAYNAAAEARHTLFGVQLSHAHRNIWLARSEDIAAAEAFAWVRSGEPRSAVTALDNGRALALSDALDAHTVADRLRTERHDELARRYEQALDRVARLATAELVPWFLAGRPVSTLTTLLPLPGRAGLEVAVPAPPGAAHPRTARGDHPCVRHGDKRSEPHDPSATG